MKTPAEGSRRSVYILRSAVDPDRYYVGTASSVARRLEHHNAGSTRHTAKYKPWKLHAFEKYLKTGSGRAFAKRHFGQTIDHEP